MNGDFDLTVATATVTWGSPASRRLRTLASDRPGERYNSWLAIRLDATLLVSKALYPSENNFNNCGVHSFARYREREGITAATVDANKGGFVTHQLILLFQ